MQASKFAPARWAWGLWALAAAFYLIAFYHRVAPPVGGTVTGIANMGAVLMAGWTAFAAVLFPMSKPATAIR